jgi:two-component system, NarL family, response regulator DevR
MTTLQLDGSAGGGGLQQQSRPRIRVLICDDHELVRLGIRRLLETESDLDVVADVADASSALIAVAEHSPEVVVLDVRMPGISGVEACREIRSRFPATRVLMLTSFADDDALFASIMAGASGYVLKQIRGGDLVNGVREVAAGNSLLDPSVTERVLARLRGETVDAADVINDLTSQERKILALVADGLANREIASRVFLAEKTVKNYVSHILAKLGVARRSEVAAFLTRRERAHGADSS